MLFFRRFLKNRVDLSSQFTSMFIKITLCYIIALQHLYFNNKTLSAKSSTIKASKPPADISSLRINF